jgi:hypothetical protein
MLYGPVKLKFGLFQTINPGPMCERSTLRMKGGMDLAESGSISTVKVGLRDVLDGDKDVVVITQDEVPKLVPSAYCVECEGCKI